MRLEPRPRPTMLHTLGYPAGAIAATVVFASLLVLVAGANPFNVFWLVIKYWKLGNWYYPLVREPRRTQPESSQPSHP